MSTATVPHPLAQPPLAPELLGLVQHVAAYERLAVRAALTGDPADVRRALLAHPLVGQWDLAIELARTLAPRAGAPVSAPALRVGPCCSRSTGATPRRTCC